MPSRSGFLRGSNPLISAGLVSAAAVVTVVAGCGSPNHTISAASFDQSGGGVAATPSSSPGAGTGATPTPKATPTSVATATPKPSPTPVLTPTPSPSPSGGGSGTVIAGTLGDYFTSFGGFKSTDTFNYILTANDTFVPDPANQSQPTSSHAFTDSGTDLNFGFLSSNTTTSTVQITLPKSGTITVTRETEFIPGGTTISGYRYYTMTSSLDTEFGSDTVSGGAVIQSTRYDPGMQVPLTLASGKTFTQSYTDYETSSPGGGTATTSYNYDITQTVGLNVLSSLTVEAGTYFNVAQFNMSESYTLPVGAQSNTLAQLTTTASTINLSKFVGLLSFIDKTVTNNVTETDPSTSATVATIETENLTDQLTSATVSGTNYPPGKSARVTRSVSAAAPTKVSASASQALAITRHIAAFKRH